MASSAPVDETTRTSAGRKTASSATPPPRPPEEPLKCPRCDSPNTKFCYYNNYSLAQPRHFCKTCRRYWTRGGALRNVPVGGSCRKNKRYRSSPSAHSSSATPSSMLSSDKNSLFSTPSEGMKLFHGLSTTAIDFQPGGLPFSRLHTATTCGVFNNNRNSNNNQFLSFGEMFSAPTATISSEAEAAAAGATATTSQVGFNYPVGIFANSSIAVSNSNSHHTMASSTIESLSSINQDLHWKLQQQRLAVLFGGENYKDSSGVSSSTAPPENQHLPISLLQVPLESSKPVAAYACVGDTSNATEWCLQNSYATPANNGGGGNHAGNCTGIYTWRDMRHALP